jgi:hypothetical protein
LALLTVLPVAAVSFKPDLRVTPPEAVVRVLLVRPKSGGGLLTNVVMENLARADPKKSLSVTRGEKLLLEATALDHATQSFTYDEERCLSLSSGGGLSTRTVRFELELVRVRQEYRVRLESLAEATFKVEGSPVSKDTRLVFHREVGKDGEALPWRDVMVLAEAQEHDPLEQRFSHAEVSALAQEDELRPIRLPLTDRNLKDRKKVRLIFNIESPEVKAEELASAPVIADPRNQTLEFEFRRARVGEEWSRAQLQVSKPGYEWREKDERLLPFYQRELRREELPAEINIDSFVPATAFLAPALVYGTAEIEPRLQTTNLWSARSGSVLSEQPVSKISQIGTRETSGRPRERPVLSSLGSPASGNRIYFTAGEYEVDPITKQNVLTGSRIRFFQIPGTGYSAELESSKLAKFATDIAASPNGKTLAFSGLHYTNRVIYKYRLGELNAAVASPNDGSAVDTQPSVTDKGRLLFTRRLKHDAPGSVPEIWHQMESEDGTLSQDVAKLVPGHSGAWSQDGNWVAYIDGEGGLSVLRMGNNSPATRLFGKDTYASPRWSDGKDGLVLFYSCAVNKTRDQPNFDIYRVALKEEAEADGSRYVTVVDREERLTTDGSFDCFPIWGGNGKGESYLYFLSNRGASQTGDPNAVGLFRIKLP